MHGAASAMRAAGVAPRVAPPCASRPRAFKGGRGAARPRAASRNTTPESAANELAALKKQVEQADILIASGKLAEAEQLLGCVCVFSAHPQKGGLARVAVTPFLRQPLTQRSPGKRRFIVPTVDYSRVGRIKSASVIWGVMSSASVEEAAGSDAAPEPQPQPAVVTAALQPDAPPQPSDDEVLASAAVEPVVDVQLERPAPTQDDLDWMLQGNEAVEAVRAKALKARRDGTDTAELFSDANGAHCAAQASGARGAVPLLAHSLHSLTAARRPPGLVGYIASLPRDEQIEMEPGLRCAAVAAALPCPHGAQIPSSRILR
jgi:hypothetical protein